MGSRFNDGGVQCQDCGDDSSVSTCRVQEKQDLCETCADGKDLVDQRGTPKSNAWYCEKHGKPVEFVCSTHNNVPLCHSCAFISHQRPCAMLDLCDVISGNRSMVQELLAKTGTRRQELRQVESKVKGYGYDVQRHFESVRKQAMLVFTKGSEKVDENEREEEEQTMLWAEEEINKIMGERDARIELVKRKARSQKEAVAIAQTRLLDELLDIKQKVENKISVVDKQVQTFTLAVGDVHHHLDELLLSDRDLVREAGHVEGTAKGACASKVDIELAESATRLAQRVHLENKYGVFGCQIANIQDSWELTDTVPIPSNLMKPYFIGAIGANQMVLSDVSCRTLYVTNLEDSSTKKVLESTGDRTITSCISLGEDKILCGNYRRGTTKNSFNGSSLYNRDWELVMDIDVPKNVSRQSTFATVHRDNDGRILAAEGCQSVIHIVSPDTGLVVDKITIEENQVLWIRALSSGDFIVKSKSGEFVVVGPNGKQKVILKNERWDGCLCDVDPVSDTVYVVYRDVTRGVYAVDQVTSSGQIKKEKIAEYPISSRRDVVLPCIFTSPGRLVTCNGENFFVFKTLDFNDLKTN